MFFSPRVLALAAVFVAGPACAAGGAGALSRTQVMISDASLMVAVYGAALVAGDMAAIKASAFVLSGLIALAGFWMLVRRPRILLLGPEYAAAAVRADEAEKEGARPEEPARPMRLLEAVAAAKAQMAISEAERRHGS